MMRLPVLQAQSYYWIKKTFFLLFFILIPTLGIAAPTSKLFTVSAAIDQIDSLAQDFISQAGKKGRAVPMEVAGKTRLVVDHLREFYSESKAVPFQDLNPEEMAIFGEISKTLKRLLKTGRARDDHIRRLVDRLTSEINSLYVDTKTPRVFAYRPAYFVVHPREVNISVSVTGLYLNNHDSYLEVDGKRIMPSIIKEKGLVFSIPRVLFEAQAFNVVQKELLLTVFKEKRPWYAFGLRKENIPIKYNLIMYIMPKNVARYSVRVKKMIQGIERRDGSGPLWSTGSGERQDIRRTFRHPSEDGWLFDQDSVRFIVTSRGDNEETRVNIITSPGLITVEMLSDGGGKGNNPFEGHLRYTEWRPFKTAEEENIALDEFINWRESKVYILPEHTESYIVSFKMFNGSKRTYNDVTKKDGYVKIDYHPNLRKLRITPQKPSMVLGR